MVQHLVAEFGATRWEPSAAVKRLGVGTHSIRCHVHWFGVLAGCPAIDLHVSCCHHAHAALRFYSLDAAVQGVVGAVEVNFKGRESQAHD